MKHYLQLSIYAGVAIFLLFDSSSTAAEKTKEYRARSVQILNGSGTMHYHKNYIVTVASGTIGKEVPEFIKLGDEIKVKDRSLKANYIIVTEYLETMRWGGKTLAEKGDVRCLIVEKSEDIPADDGRSRLWINVLQCKILE